MANTPVFGWPYPAGTSPVQVPYDLQQLALAVEATVGGEIIIDATDAVVQAGWSVSTLYGRIFGKVATVYTNFTRTGATITAGSNGDVANTDIVLLPAAFQPVQPAGLSVLHVGTSGAFFCWTSGMIGIGASVPGANIATGNSWSIGGTWLVA